MIHSHITRRQLLGSSAAFLVSNGHATKAFPRRRLLVLTLFGGNDGLNTVVPYRDPLYAHYRPNLALPSASLQTLTADAGLHPALTFLGQRYERGELAIIQGVGYPAPDLSHFESMAIWNRAARQATLPALGWATQLLQDQQAAIRQAGFVVDAINMDQRADFMAGGDLTMVQAHNLPAFMQSDLFDTAVPPLAPRSLAESHVLRSLRQGHDVRSLLRQTLSRAPSLDVSDARDGLDIQVRTLLWLLANGVDAPLIKMVHAGYDMHANLVYQHHEQLARLNRLLQDLYTGLRALDLWNSTTIFIHSEFGRRVAENGDAGADHGTVTPAFVLGGDVRGAWLGQVASLENLDAAGNLRHHVDFRRVYATLAQHSWQLSDNPFVQQGYAPLPLASA